MLWTGWMAHQSGLSFILNFSAIFFWIIIADDTGIQTRIVRVEGEHADNKTPHPVFTCSNERVNIFSQLFNTEVFLKCRIRTKRASDYYFGETFANLSWLNNIHRRLCPQCDQIFSKDYNSIWQNFEPSFAIGQICLNCKRANIEQII